MRFKYVGPHDGVDLVGVGPVARDAEVEVPREVGASLAKQKGAWERVDQTAMKRERKS